MPDPLDRNDFDFHSRQYTAYLSIMSFAYPALPDQKLKMMAMPHHIAEHVPQHIAITHPDLALWRYWIPDFSVVQSLQHGRKHLQISYTVTAYYPFDRNRIVDGVRVVDGVWLSGLGPILEVCLDKLLAHAFVLEWDDEAPTTIDPTDEAFSIAST